MYQYFSVLICFVWVEADVVDHGPEHEEASTSQEDQPPSKSSVEISITVPGTKKKKKGW